MLFTVDDDECNALLASPMAATVRLAFSRLLNAYLDGLHILVIPPRLCRSIECDTSFSDDEQSAARKIRARYPEYGKLPEVLSTFGRLVQNQLGSPTKNGSVWSVPFDWIAQRPLHETQLIGEDLNDLTVLEGAADDYKRINRLRAFHVRLGFYPGGGINTHRALAKAAVRDQRITICVTDSDQECPTGPIGAPASMCAAVQGPGLYEHKNTTGRSLENALPWKLLDILRPQMTSKPSMLFQQIESIQPGAARHINIKRGCCGHDINRLGNTACGSFWSSIKIGLGANNSCCQAPCSARNVGDCRDRFITGFGNSTLVDAGRWLEDSSILEKRHASYLPSPDATEWISLGRWAFEFGIGSSIKRI